MTQDMFPKGKHAKTISRNAHYIVAFKNPRDQLGVRIPMQQAFPQDFKEVLNVYRERETLRVFNVRSTSQFIRS